MIESYFANLSNVGAIISEISPRGEATKIVQTYASVFHALRTQVL